MVSLEIGTMMPMIALIALGRLWIPGDSFSFLAIGLLFKDWISSSLPVLADCSCPWPAFFPLAAWCGPPMGAWMTLTAAESRPLESSCPPFIQPRPTSPEAGSEDFPVPPPSGISAAPIQALNSPLLIKSNRSIVTGENKTEIIKTTTTGEFTPER